MKINVKTRGGETKDGTKRKRNKINKEKEKRHKQRERERLRTKTRDERLNTKYQRPNKHSMKDV